MPKLIAKHPQRPSAIPLRPSIPTDVLIQPTHSIAALLSATAVEINVWADEEGAQASANHKLSSTGVEVLAQRANSSTWAKPMSHVLDFGPRASMTVAAGATSRRMNVFCVEVLVKPGDTSTANQRLIEGQMTPFSLSLVREGSNFRVRASALVKHRPRTKDKTQWLAIESKRTLRPGRWASVGIVWDGDDLMVLVNGKVDGRRVCRNGDLGTLDKPKAKFWIGTWVDGRRNRFRGQIGGVRIWNTIPVKFVDAVSAAEDAGLGAIDSLHADYGGDKGTLGKAVGNEKKDRDGRRREYQKGAILWHRDHGAHPITGKLWTRYKGARQRKSLGFPISDPVKRGGATALYCEHGAVYTSSKTTGCVWGPMYARYLTHTKVLGLPVGMPFGSQAEPDRRCKFERGMMYYTKATGAFEVHGSILERYKTFGADSGWLGLPISDELPVYGRPGQVIGRVSRFENGAIFWSPKTGAFEVHGAILAHYDSIGGPASKFGFPVTNELRGPDGATPYSMFEGGMIVWYQGKAWEVTELELCIDHMKQHGAIDDGLGDSSGEFYTRVTIECDGKTIVNRKRYPRKGHKGAKVGIGHRFKFPVRPNTKVYFKVDIWDHDDASGDDYHGRIEKTLTAADLWCSSNGVAGVHEDPLTTMVRDNTIKFDRIRCKYTVSTPSVPVTARNFREDGWWNFPNRGTPKLSKAQYVECFRDVDYWDGGFEAMLNLFDWSYYELAFKEAASGGNCFGFSTEALYSLKGHSPYTSPLSKWSWNQARSTINVKQAYQYGAETIHWAVESLLDKTMIEPRRVYDRAKAEIRKHGACIISMMNLANGTGHAVLAYKAVDGGPNNRRGCLYVADPNEPWSETEGNPTYIEIFNNNRFKATTITTRGNPNGFSSNAINFANLVTLPTTLLFHIPYCVVSKQPRTPFWEILGALLLLLGFLLVLAGDAEPEQLTVNGKKMFENQGGKRRVLHGQVPGMAMFPVLDSKNPQLIFANQHRVAGQMKMELRGKRRGRFRIASGLGMAGLTVDSPIALNARDALIVDAAGSPFPVVGLETSQRSKTAKVEYAVTKDPTGRPARRFEVQLQEAKGDTARVAVEPRGGGLLLSPSGPAKPVDVSVEIMEGGQLRKGIVRGVQVTTGDEAVRIRAQDVTNPLGNFAVERLSSVGGSVLSTKIIKGRSR